jgi:hypothetical protein
MGIVNKKDQLKAKSNETVAFIKAIPYSKVDAYIDENVTNLQTARAYLKKLTKIVLYLIKEM